MSIENSPSPATIHKLPRVVASAKAAANLDELCHAGGPQVIVLSTSGATVSVATVRPRHGFFPREDMTMIGQVQRCPVYADTHQLLACPYETIILDMGWRSGPPGEIRAFVTRPESKAEWQERVFTEDAGQTD